MDADVLRTILDAVHKGMIAKRNHIFLIGFMGTGKTTVSSQLAEILSLPAIEMDQRVEDENAMKITDIFEKYGEDISETWRLP